MSLDTHSLCQAPPISSLTLMYHLDTNQPSAAPHQCTPDTHSSDIQHQAGAPRISVTRLMHLTRHTSSSGSPSEL